LDVFLREAVYF